MQGVVKDAAVFAFEHKGHWFLDVQISRTHTQRLSSTCGESVNVFVQNISQLVEASLGV